jgi:hypothetical protein
MKKALVALCGVLLLYGCVKGVAPAGSEVSEADVLARTLATMPNACEYKGRAIIQYVEDLDKSTQEMSTFQTIVDKECNNDMIIRVLGSFGMVEAELVVTNGVYRIFRKGEDVTNSPPIQLTAEDMILIERYLNFPPPMPDENSLMIMSGDHYTFIKNDNTYIYVDKNFYVDQIVTDAHVVSYVWQGDMLSSMSFDRGKVTLSVEFSEPWR